jgi:hypothetical protein
MLGDARTSKRVAQLAVAALGTLTLLWPTVGRAEGARATQTASYQEPLPSPLVTKTSPASRWASLSGPQCWAEIGRRKLGVTRLARAASGVSLPVRLSGPVNGVKFLTPGKKSPYGILDCRLALALSDLAIVLQRHGVVEVQVDNMYRPRAHLPGKKKPSQHSYGLAIDLTRLKRANGTELVVERDFGGAIGEPVCGESARAELSGDASALRDLICDVARTGTFHHILTPNHDAAHRDHFHLDIARGARQRIIQ